MRNYLTSPLCLAFALLLSGLTLDSRATELSTALQSVPPHPRLHMTDAALESLKSSEGDDATLRRIAGEIIAQADELCAAPPLEHELKGPRLLHVSRNCLRRISTLALAWRWTGKAVYGDAAVANLETVCNFPDWNPSHFLDTAEMSHAVGLGYDWLYGYMDPETREVIRQGLIRHGLEPGIKAYTQDKPWWIKSEFNWNQVCNSGLLIGALAVVESDPQYAEVIVPAAVASLPAALKSYNPDGVWSEGPSYWGYATRYTAYGLAALESALGTSFGLTDMEGMARTAYFPLLTAGPTGLYLNFADSGQNSRRKPLPTLFWLAKRYELPAVAYAEHQLLLEQPASAHHLIWYVAPPADQGAALPLDHVFESTVPVAVSRSAWGDPEALFVGVKGGYNQVNHGHLDLGNFELDALGNRWARDLGSDNYNLPGYWDKKPGGKRWNYYRLNSFSHNVPLIDGRGQDPMGKADFVRVGRSPEGAFTIVDLTSAYGAPASSLHRGVASVTGRRAVLIQDEYTLQSPASLTWAMTTDAEITLTSSRSAVLVQNDKTLHVDILSPDDGQFAIESAEQPEPDHANQGVRRLLAQVPPGPDAVTVTVCLRPAWPDGGAVALPAVSPLADW